MRPIKCIKNDSVTDSDMCAKCFSETKMFHTRAMCVRNYAKYQDVVEKPVETPVPVEEPKKTKKRK